MEQESNALALKSLDLATASDVLDEETVNNWLRSRRSPAVADYSKVAGSIVSWLDAGKLDDIGPLLRATWGTQAPQDVDSRAHILHAA
jgi:hypothetical protein